MGVEIDDKHGGVGSTFFVTNIVIEELAKVDMAVSVLVDVQNTLINMLITRYGTPDQQDMYLPQLATSMVSLQLNQISCYSVNLVESSHLCGSMFAPTSGVFYGNTDCSPITQMSY